MFKIIYKNSSAIKNDLAKLKKDKKHAQKIKKCLDDFAIDPHNFLWNIKKLQPKSENRYRIRIWNYRIILSIDFGNWNVLIHRIGLRKDIYQ